MYKSKIAAFGKEDERRRRNSGFSLPKRRGVSSRITDGVVLGLLAPAEPIRALSKFKAQLTSLGYHLSLGEWKITYSDLVTYDCNLSFVELINAIDMRECKDSEVDYEEGENSEKDYEDQQDSEDGRPCKQLYRCYPVSVIQKAHLEKGDKIIMPTSALQRLAFSVVEYPMLFELNNLAAGRVTHCGVLEFVADEGVIYKPSWMMENMLLNEGDTVQVKNVGFS
ncbi:hypothetical protein FEM48_Zijuj02G0072600 [Ziziphus jujuba var. spinosa]|uniref:Ubiquitin fusion degradation protein UFD1 N-terminal subdomain 1 domain-containing protein n=1 Tax=Ziziphus jujuba var. spinosa TaxID=714518 RepID=A0A978VUD4_ZIZJJ|nr:hypothetical protein FEM48_Zijuj02G0072600 [Ziziphus jujuba var. spinosa]